MMTSVLRRLIPALATLALVVSLAPAVAAAGPTFGTRRIVFVDAPGRMRLEFMEQLEDPA